MALSNEAEPAPLLSVVMPVFNELRTIDRILDAVWAVDIETEIIAVDDGSTDGTRDRLTQLAQGDRRLRVFYHSRNLGKGAALRTGFAAAAGRFVVIQDADFEYDPNDFTKLLQPLMEDKADVVFGSRFSNGEYQGGRFSLHTLANRVLTLLSNMCTNLKLTDMETCYKVFRREILQSIQIQENGFGFEPEITAKVARYRVDGKSLRICEVGISYHGRTYREGKKIGWRDGVRALWCILKYNWL